MLCTLHHMQLVTVLVGMLRKVHAQMVKPCSEHWYQLIIPSNIIEQSCS